MVCLASTIPFINLGELAGPKNHVKIPIENCNTITNTIITINRNETLAMILLEFI
jgi:hypothetical protein